ncbi:hypothetical protein CLAFUW4_07845 [Fulvia fulva]|uniref:Uncharacterized protein n=1 Tax=Passalora fulva TaxID=5499 RepID=A0A9Q8LCI0_PASFU|nr:uncharacterized protein CLAFUR5_07969 [Fulvia fulva]KAK4628903.1 hypothetical protein CLAFUR4_07850 [Fulvia fulva]KAK4629972.1 hypothetical protein CLAFUR0_07847 [Fulvia fulva]UJO14960.1 hypothetical protein CLAFUR5_07969 [Fulvia fulva]WPV12767.1 hypothetical protein CLAFUW4_07845 [Fulvia fulva]WPV27116.1 hypothetical protein CLAFUW7_07846 [Fulvia fulva]
MTTTGDKHIQSQSRSWRACSDPVGNGTGNLGQQAGAQGCVVFHNNDRYGYGTNVCGRCNRCHGCGSTNNGIRPIQAVYFGGKKAMQKL